MEKPLSLTLLYTGKLAGDLALLPRLFTFIQQLRADSQQPALLFDLGGSCADDVWHCRETGGRSTLMALDAMGYHAANVAGTLDHRNREKLAEQLTMALVDDGRGWLYRPPSVRDEGISFRLRARDDAAGLQIALSPAERTTIEENAIFLGAVGAGHVGEALVDLRGAPALIRARMHTMPPDTPPNPSIAGTVEFIEQEARLLAKKRRQPPAQSRFS